MRLRTYIFCLSAFVLLFSSCKHPEEPTPFEIAIPYGFPTRLNIPDDNPMTVEGVALGKRLFEDGHLSGYIGTAADSLMSCADCHKRAHNFDIGTDDPRFPNGKPHGRTGIHTRHTAMPLCNLVFNLEGYLWNGAVSYQQEVGSQNIEDIVKAAILATDEIGSTEARTLAALRNDSRYPEMFKKAFGSEEITMDRIQKAIAQYVRSLVSGNSKFDRYLRGIEQLTPQELHGYILFTTEEGADCFHCHGSGGSPLFTTNLFYNNGLDISFTDPADRSAVTGDIMDRGAYRAPSLRNISASAPYMHDGRFQTLDEVLIFYNEGLQYSPYVSPLMHKINEGGRHLTPNEIADLKAFLETLTDEEFLYGTR
ncbi:MAG: c-type cytochrome [Bacteroidales bacterium]|nr:c-type cytochrome [Bacteroidales bacterium]